MGLLVLTVAALVSAQSVSKQPVVRLDAVDALLHAFRTHRVVALGDPHGNEQAHALRLALIRHPRFAESVDDVVVEFGNARYQELVDRFVQGAAVSDADLRRVWQDTTQVSGVWDRPIYETIFRTVRSVNERLPPSRKLRVVLADPPFDWEQVRQSNELPASTQPGRVRLYGLWMDKEQAAAFDRDRHAAEVVQREVLSKSRRALLVFGDMHLRRGARSVVSILEETYGAKVLTAANAVGPRYVGLNSAVPGLSSWVVHGLVLVAGTRLESPFGGFDSVIYLGPPEAMTTSKLPESLCADAGYLAMRQERLAWNGVTPEKADDLLARDCPAVRR